MNARATTFADAEQRAVAARASTFRFSAWVAVEILGLGAAAWFDWQGLLQPVIALGLLLRLLTLGNWARTFSASLPGAARGARQAGIAAIVALVLGAGLVLDIVPETADEATWDAINGLALAIASLSVPVLIAAALTRSARALGIAVKRRAHQSLPLIAALVFGAVVPAISPSLAPSPWLAPAAALLVAGLGAFGGAIPRIGAVASAVATAAFAIALTDAIDTRLFTAAPAIIAVATAGFAMRSILAAHAEALGFMAQALDTREAPRPAGQDGDETRPEHLSEEEALALVDQELGLTERPRAIAEISTAEAEAIRTPFELQHRPDPADLAASRQAGETWTQLASTTRQLGHVWLFLTVAGLFWAFFSLTPLAAHPVPTIVFHGLVAAAFGRQALSLWAAHRKGPPVQRSTSSFVWPAAAAATAAIALAARGVAPTTIGVPAGIVGGVMAWLLLVLTLVLLRRAAAQPRGRGGRVHARLGDLINASIALGALALVTVLNDTFAPGDIAWLGAPLRIGTAILALGVMLILAYALVDARHLFEDHAVVVARGAADKTEIR